MAGSIPCRAKAATDPVAPGNRGRGRVDRVHARGVDRLPHRPLAARLMARLIPYRSTAAGKPRKAPTKAARQEAWRFYSSARWKGVRAVKLARDPVCEHCAARDETTAAVDVHHVEPRATRQDLALDLDNLVSLCKQCHTLEELRRRKRG